MINLIRNIKKLDMNSELNEFPAACIYEMNEDQSRLSHVLPIIITTPNFLLVDTYKKYIERISWKREGLP